MKKFFALLLILAVATPSLAQFAIFKSGEDFNTYTSYYKIKTPTVNESSDGDAGQTNQPDADPASINMLSFVKINKKFPMPAVPYNRDSHFGGWLRDEGEGSCLNVRAKVLVRDSASEVTFSPSGCTVATGEWNDPYTARLHTKANDIQIDHVVALKNAYMTGAHEWDFPKRCLYANFMGNKFHLMSVNGPENLKKSDHSPAGYVPPNKRFTCEFLKSWLNIKLIWDLRITPEEGDTIQRLVQSNKCDSNMFKVSSQELAEQHRYMEDNANLCAHANATLMAF